MGNALKNYRWVAVLALLSSFGCAGGLSPSKGSWPWEYGGDHGKAQTGNFIGISGAVAKFGDAPAAPKPAVAESIQLPKAGGKPVAPAPDPAPAGVALSREPDQAKPKKGYDFALRDVKNLPPEYLPEGSAAITHDITAVNRGMAPVSVVLTIDNDRSENLKLDKVVPLYAVIPPNTEQVLLHAEPEQRGTSYRVSYAYSWGGGVYTAKHSCLERYRLPFSNKVKAYAALNETENAPLFDRYAITFTMPADSAILAARKGTISRIKENNTIDILHDDSTIATYQHMGQLAEGITEGKAVSAGEVLGRVGKMSNDAKGYLRFVVWRPELERYQKAASGASSLGFTSISFPVEFCSDAGQCYFLTKSQAVPPVPPAKVKSKGRGKS